jgi:hypothetical protein
MTGDPPRVFSDSYGLPITTHSREALHWYDQGIRGLLGFRKDTADCFLKALAFDSSFHMARSALGVSYFVEESGGRDDPGIAQSHCDAGARQGR